MLCQDALQRGSHYAARLNFHERHWNALVEFALH